MAVLDEVSFSWVDVRFSGMWCSAAAVSWAHVSVRSGWFTAARSSFHALRAGWCDSAGWALAVIRCGLCAAWLCLCSSGLCLCAASLVAGWTGGRDGTGWALLIEAWLRGSACRC